MTRRRFDAVIFDMDGVLIDSEPLHFGVLTQLFAADGHTLSRAENEQFIGSTTEFMFDTLIRRHSLPRSIAEYTRSCMTRRCCACWPSPTNPSQA